MADAADQHHQPAGGHHHGPPARPFTRLRQLLRPERRDVAAVVLFAAVVAVLSLATPIAVEALVNTVAFGVLVWPVVAVAAVLFACLGLAGLVRAVQVYVVECIQRRLFVRVAADYAHRLPRVQLAAFDHRNGPELANRFFDVLTVQKATATLLLDGVAIAVTAVVGMTVLAFYHPFLLGFDVLLVLLTAVLVFACGLGGVKSSLHESHAKYDLAGWLEEVPRNLRAFKFARGRALAVGAADRLAGEYVAARKAHFRVVWRQTLFALGLQVAASTALLTLGGLLVIDRQLTLGQLVAAELIVTLVVASVAKLGKYAETFYDLLAGAEKLGLLTDLPLDRDGGEPLPAGGPLAVRVSGIAAAGGRRLTATADWGVAAGERVAVAGPPGCGKSTLFEAVCGLRDAYAGGRVELDGVDVRQLDPDSVRERVALVGGGVEVFAGTVAQNVTGGRTDLAAADVREALRAVGLLEAVLALPDGPDTVLAPHGGPLSGEQAVRLGIARAVAGRPRLLILDGTLDAADLRNCPRLLPFLFDRTAPWTLLVASTDPRVLALCDRTLTLGEPAPEVVPLSRAARPHDHSPEAAAPGGAPTARPHTHD
jgi:ABC-type bacteriocin/lantibiotic exporter with double-glycine peptidase domain